MDTDLAEHLMELKEGVGRIDERTVAIHDNQKRLGKALVGHEDKDRVDFKEVHTRITGVEKKQNWTLGVGSAIVFAITIAASYIGSVTEPTAPPTRVTLDLGEMGEHPTGITIDDRIEDHGD